MNENHYWTSEFSQSCKRNGLGKNKTERHRERSSSEMKWNKTCSFTFEAWDAFTLGLRYSYYYYFLLGCKKTKIKKWCQSNTGTERNSILEKSQNLTRSRATCSNQTCLELAGGPGNTGLLNNHVHILPCEEATKRKQDFEYTQSNHGKLP